MSIRRSDDICKVATSGSTWVGKRTAKGGAVDLRDMTGTGIFAAHGVVRFLFANGRYSDMVWRHEAVGYAVKSVRLPFDGGSFDPGLVSPVRAEARVLGVYFSDGHTCGETGATVKSRYERSKDNAYQDAEEVIAKANALQPKEFTEAVRRGVLTIGPYSRNTSESTNAYLRAKLLGGDGRLIADYRGWLKRWQGTLARPAKLSHQTQ